MIRRGAGFVVHQSTQKRLEGSRCVVCRIDSSTGFFWLTSVDLGRRDPSWRAVEFGPFCEADVKSGKLERAKVRIPTSWSAGLRGNFERRSNSTE